MRNRLRLAISTKIYGELPLAQRFRTVASYGLRYVSFCVEKKLSMQEAKEAYQDFSQLGLKCVQIKSLNMPKSYMDEKHFKEAIEEIKKISEIGKIYGTAQVELTAGSFRGKKEEHLDAAVKFIKETCDIVIQNRQYCALDFTPKKNQLIKTWQEMTELYEKVEKDNLLININTAMLHHYDISDEELEFLDGKLALIEIEDIQGDDWSTDISIGEGIADIESWVQKIYHFVLKSCSNTGGCPAALIMLKDSDDKEIKRTLKYLESVLPKIRL